MTAIFKYVERSKLSIKYAIFSSMREMPFYYNFQKKKKNSCTGRKSPTSGNMEEEA